MSVRLERRTRRVPALLLLTWLAAAVAGCADSWEAELAAHRAEIDRSFKSPNSPLTADQRAGFTGLSYFPPAPDLSLTVVPDREGAGTPVELLDTRGEPRSYVVHSRAHFEIETRPVTLTLYRSTEPGDTEIFLPFKDATAGNESYRGGRYLSVEVDRQGMLVLDFNRAYNPYCAYNSRWVCPVVPEANTISVPIRAGERAFPKPAD